MKVTTITSRLEKLGYKVTMCFSGTIIASNGKKTYKANSYNELYNLIFR